MGVLSIAGGTAPRNRLPEAAHRAIPTGCCTGLARGFPLKKSLESFPGKPGSGIARAPTERSFVMFAVIKTGGKQYKVAEKDVIRVEKLPGEKGEVLELDQVLMLGDGSAPTIGTPLVAGAKVSATVLDQIQGDKVIAFKKKRRHNYRRKKGHRQELTVLRIAEIMPDGSSRGPQAEAAAPAPATVEKAAEAPKADAAAEAPATDSAQED